VTGPLTATGAGVLGLAALAVALSGPLRSAPLALLGASLAVLVVLGAASTRRRIRAGSVGLELSADRVEEGAAVQVAVGSGRNRRLLLELPGPVGGTRPLAGAQTEQLAELPRGLWTLGPVLERVGDPFGLAERQVPVGAPVQLLVRPRVEEVLDRPESRRAQESPERPRLSRRWPSGTDPAGANPYLRGDDLRRVLWRAYARTSRLPVRA